MKMLKCEVTAAKIMIEVFDKTGKPKTYKTTDGKGKSVTKVEQQILKKGQTVALPEDRIAALGNSVQLVMAPVAVVEDEDVDDADVEDEKADDKTVAAQIPKK